MQIINAELCEYDVSEEIQAAFEREIPHRVFEVPVVELPSMVLDECALETFEDVTTSEIEDALISTIPVQSRAQLLGDVFDTSEAAQELSKRYGAPVVELSGGTMVIDGAEYARVPEGMSVSGEPDWAAMS